MPREPAHVADEDQKRDEKGGKPVAQRIFEDFVHHGGVLRLMGMVVYVIE